MKYKLKLESKHQIVLQVSEANIIDVIRFLDIFHLHSEYLTPYAELFHDLTSEYIISVQNDLKNVCENSFEMVLMYSNNDCMEYLPIIEYYIKENIG